MSENRERVVVAAEHCAASGMCQRTAPDVFGADAQGFVVLHEVNPPTSRMTDVLEARDGCPLGVIDVLDENGDPLD